MQSGTIDPSLTVNEIIARYPAAIGALNACGIDTCCGGGEPLTEAAREAGADVANVVAQVEAALVATLEPGADR